MLGCDTIKKRSHFLHIYKKMNIKKKQKIIIVSIVVGILLVAGIIVFPHQSKAGLFGDVWSFIKNNFSETPSLFYSNGDGKDGNKEKDKTEDIPLYKPVYDYEQAVIGAVDTASKSVVSIVVSKDLPVIERCPTSPWGDLPPEFRDFFGGGFRFYEQCETGTKKQEVGGGSGFIVSSDGLIVTNKHVVIDKNAEYTVLTNDGKKYDAKVIAQDPVNDIALIKISATNLSVAKLGDSDSIKLGQTAIAIGNALGEFRNTVSVGVISGLSRNITAGGAGGFVEKIDGVIQTDSAINQGNSGGPLLNLKGEVVGINTAIASGAQNIGFAIPINQARRAIESVKNTGTIKTTYLGVRYLMINEEIAKKQNLPISYGALVRGTEDGPGIVPGSPAEKAGIQAEDIIISVNGEKIVGEMMLGTVLQKYAIGEKVKLSVRRGNKNIEIDVTLGERPEE